VIGFVLGICLSIVVVITAGFITGYSIIPRAPRLFGTVKDLLASVSKSLGLAITYWIVALGAAAFFASKSSYWVAGAGLLSASIIFCVSCRANAESKWVRIAADIGDVLATSAERPYDLRYLGAFYKISRRHGDTWTRLYRVKARAPTTALKGFLVGVDADTQPLHVFSWLGVVGWTKRGRVLPVQQQVNHERRHWLLQLLFTSPMKADEERDVFVAGAWRGMWNTLRMTREDHGIFTLQVPTDQLDIRVSFPRGTTEDDVSLEPTEMPDGIGHSVVESGISHHRPFKIWSIQGPTLGSYKYVVKCSESAQRKFGWGG
jgi:hypothetical protein